MLRMTVFRKFEVCASYESSVAKSSPSPSRKPLKFLIFLPIQKITNQKHKLKMKKTSVLLLAIAFMLTGFQFAEAKVKLPAIVSSNMVLQRNTSVKLWGWADAQEKITIKTSWLKKTLVIQADTEGNWAINVQTTNSRAAQTIRIKSSSSDLVLDNILFGEVWLCSGQADWATGRYLSANWDVGELSALRETILRDDLLVNRMRTKA
jgi:hypothetical protein